MLFAAGMAIQGGRVPALYDRRAPLDDQSKRVLQAQRNITEAVTELKQETITHAFVDHVYRGGGAEALTSGGGGGRAR